ncbi:MAG: L-seryl-tRNA(Sec) selenium transferase, partial [Anaerolineales bacterium]
MTKTKPESDLRKLPSVDALLQSREGERLQGIYGRDLTVSAIRETVGDVRQKVGKEGGTVPLPEILIADVAALLEKWTHPTLEPVINATGVILHTNLGRSPLSADTLSAIQKVAQGYATLEYDLEKGKRGSRYVHTEDLLVRLTGAEAGLVVNNNASALLLILSALSSRRRTLSDVSSRSASRA